MVALAWLTLFTSVTGDAAWDLGAEPREEWQHIDNMSRIQAPGVPESVGNQMHSSASGV